MCSKWNYLPTKDFEANSEDFAVILTAEKSSKYPGKSSKKSRNPFFIANSVSARLKN